ncbi:ABC transporter permease [bacterium]|nr:ABC transporter permease [bacterium]
MRVLRTLVRKEFRQLRRDPALLRLVLLLPVVQLMVMSYALNSDLKDLRVAVLDEDRTPLSRRLVEAFPHGTTFAAGPRATDAAGLAELLGRHACDLAVHIPPGFARDVAAGRAPAIGLLVDGSNSSVAGRGAGYAEALLAREARRLAAESGGAAGHPPVAAAVRFFYNPELESRLYMVPGIIVILVTIISALVTGLAVVREKELGTLEQIAVTPLSPLQLIAGKTIPFALIALLDFVLAMAIAMAWFAVPLTGAPWALVLGVLCYLLVTLGLGLLASAVSDTQQQAVFTVWFFLVFAIMLSGFFFPVQNMPEWARVLTWLDPMRFFMSVVRGVLLRGAGVADLAGELAVLLAMGVAAFGSAVWLFRRSSS